MKVKYKNEAQIMNIYLTEIQEINQFEGYMYEYESIQYHNYNLSVENIQQAYLVHIYGVIGDELHVLTYVCYFKEDYWKDNEAYEVELLTSMIYEY